MTEFATGKAGPRGATRGQGAVMAGRKSRVQSMDLFPTPPWATRALLRWLEQYDSALCDRSCWEPACGLGHMIKPLRETFGWVYGSDAVEHDVSCPFPVFDFLLYPPETTFDWIITNPPFQLGEQFASRALRIANYGVALLVRGQFLEGIGRYERLYRERPPSDVLVFTERVPMVEGRLDRNASSATMYVWMVWRKAAPHGTHIHWLPPCRSKLERDSDYE